jgi:hypothetical protein
MLCRWSHGKDFGTYRGTDCDTPSYREAVLEKLLDRKVALTVNVSTMVEVIK